jgi:hypothetical protein
MAFFRDVVLTAAAQSFGAAPGGGGGGELITNGSFDSGANWTLSGMTISGGVLNTAALGTATQTLVAGSQPAGNFTFTVDIAGAFDEQVRLLGAGAEVRETVQISSLGDGVGLVFPLTASGEVTSIQIVAFEDSGAMIDNVSLQAA